VSNSASGPIKVGVAGLGRSGWGIHVRALREMTDRFKVVAVLDNLEERRKQAADELGCRACEKYEDILADAEVELVVVAMPSDLHVPWSIQALEAGKHVVVEKPVSTDLAECDRLIEAEKKSDFSVTVFQNKRYSPDFLKIREVVGSGVLGPVNFIRVASMSYRRRWDWQTVKKLGGGSLRNTVIHTLDALMEFSGAAEPEVYCKLDKVLTSGDAEDWVQLILTAPDAPTMEIDLFANCAYRQGGWLVLGRKGTLITEGDQIKWKVVKDFEGLPERKLDLNPTPDRSYNNEKLEFEEFSWDPEESGRGGADAAFYVDVHANLREGAAQAITLESVRRRMRVVDYCLKNAGV
jgi:predicted dehydrogenase